MKVIVTGRQNNYIGIQMAAGMVRLHIEGYIGRWEDASVQKIKEAIETAGKNTDKALVYINSEGGSVFEANEMVNLIAANFKEVRVEVGALAASAATYFLVKFPATAKSNTQIMIHRPSMCACGNVDKIKAETKLLENLTNQYIKDYTAKMNIGKEELEKKWQNDWWMTADEALKLGLIDDIDDEPAPVDEATYQRMVTCGAPVEPASQTKPKKANMDMKVLAVQLGLPQEATDEQISAKIAELQARAEKARELEEQIKAQAKAQKQAQIKALLDEAERTKKITAATRKHYEKLAENDFEGVKAIIENLQPVDAPSGQLKTGKTARSNWTYADWAEKDPEGFENLPEAEQKRLIEEHYNENN